MIADPLNELFVIPGSDYHLLNDAQAVDEGSAAFAFGINDDIEGTTRPQGAQHDIGAYEAEGSLAVEEEEETPDIYNPGININAESISWARGLNGTLTLMNVEGKVIARRDISMAGEVMLDDLVPGVYLATVHTPRGLQWSKGFVFSGKR